MGTGSEGTKGGTALASTVLALRGHLPAWLGVSCLVSAVSLLPQQPRQGALFSGLQTGRETGKEQNHRVSLGGPSPGPGRALSTLATIERSEAACEGVRRTGAQAFQVCVQARSGEEEEEGAIPAHGRPAGHLPGALGRKTVRGPLTLGYSNSESVGLPEGERQV